MLMARVQNPQVKFPAIACMALACCAVMILIGTNRVTAITDGSCCCCQRNSMDMHYWRCSDLLLLLPPPLMLGCCAAVLIDRAMPWQMLVELVLAASPADQGIRHGWH